MEKQRDKAAKRQQRKLEKPSGVSFLIEGVDGPDGPMPGPDSPTEDADSPALNPEDPPREG